MGAATATLFTFIGLLVASGGAALAASCPNTAFRVGASANLPDCRGYEQVSPPDKGGYSVAFRPGVGSSQPTFPSADGNRLLFDSFGAFAGATSNLLNTYEAIRTSGGWQSRVFSPNPVLPHPSLFTALYDNAGATPDLSMGFFDSPDQRSPADQDGVSVYVREPDGSIVWGSVPPAGEPADPFTFFRFEGNSADGQHLLFDYVNPNTGVHQLYDRTNGNTIPVAEDNTGQPLNGGDSILGADNAFGGCQYGSTTRNAISNNGARIIFTSPACSYPPFGSPPYSEVYVRLDDAGPHPATVEVSAPNPGVVDPDGTQPAFYQGASSDQSKIFFISSQELTADDTTHDPELYEYDLPPGATSGTLTRVSSGVDHNADGDVQGVVEISDDGSHVYFVAAGVLTNVPNSQGQAASVGANNLYMYDTVTGSTIFIAQLPSGDDPQGGGSLYLWASATEAVDEAQSRPARVTPDGMHLVFTSTGELTGFDSHGYAEVYKYDAGSGALSCLSCDPAGVTPAGDAALYDGLGATDEFIPHNVTDDGTRVFFESRDPLLPQASNGMENVYEWEADGTGSCQSSADSGGCLYLVSDGSGPYDSAFVGATADGSDVFIATSDSLVPQDTDNGDIDIYDVRVDGGFPYQAPSQTGCSGDGCQGQASTPPSATYPGSVSFRGPGNVTTSGVASFSVAKLTRSQLERFAKTGRLTLTVKVSEAGRVHAMAIARLAGKTRIVASRSARAAKAATLHLTLVLSKTARRQLARAHTLKLKLTVAYSRVSGAKHASVTLYRQATGSR